MARSFHSPFPSITKQLTALGERLRDARLRRELTTVLFSERLGVSRDTLNRLEKGDPNIAIGTYMKALRVLGLDQDIDQVARDDVIGRKLQDRALPPRRNAQMGTAAIEAATRLRLARTATLEHENPRERNREVLSQLLKGRRKGNANGEK
ncbi:helix-turn-helix transcriptional regulator [Candidatus Ferrigenium straubiae]|uniref:helix-turn-helix transcriptional regulator n=1 Tax=Candidatus Ferrigenium straubiae TaxID=2919506 RepID=UPI003F4AD153